MADRYWVGGTATWDTTAGLKWALTDGGAGGQAVPTSTDDVFFTAASGAVTCSVAGIQTCRTITCTGFTGTLTGTTGQYRLDIRGNATFSSGMTFTLLPIQLLASGTLLTNGLGLVTITIFAVGGTVQMGDALTLSSSILHTAGTFTTNGYALTATGMFMTVPNTRTVNLGSSTVTFTSNVQMFINNNQALTFNAGTSTVNFQGTGTIDFISSGIIPGLTFYNVTFTSTATRTVFLNGVNTYNNFSFTGPASAGVSSLTFSTGPQTINGTLSTTGTAGNRRVFFLSNTYGISYDLVVNSAPSLTDADFRGLYVRGTAAPISGTRIGNRGECRGITFSTPKTVFWNLPAGGDWSANAWALSAGGGVSTDNFPLPQDTGTIVNTGLNTSATIALNTNAAHLSAVDMSGRTNAMTISCTGAPPTCYGSWRNGSGTSFTGTNGLRFSGGETMTITSAGRTFTCPITIDAYGGTVQLADALNIGTQPLTVTNGTFTTAGYSVVAQRLVSSNSNVRSINMGASTFSMVSMDFATSTNLTLNAGTSTVGLNAASGASVNAGSGLTFHNVSFGSTVTGASATMDGLGTFNNLSFAGPSSNGINELVITANQVINGTFTCSGASPTRRVFVRSNSIGGTLQPRRVLTVNSISSVNCDFRSIQIAGAAAGTSLTGAGNCGDNVGITFPSPKTVYWNLAGTQNWTANGWTTTSGGTPSVNDFPLAQDTIALDDVTPACALTISIAYPIGNFLATRSALGSGFVSVDHSVALTFYGNLTDSFFSRIGGVGSSGNWIFSGEQTQTITSNSSAILYMTLSIAKYTNSQIVQLGADWIRQLVAGGVGISLQRGTFRTNNFNLQMARFSNSESANILDMGNSTWTLGGLSTFWDCSTAPTIITGTSNIILSSTDTSSRTFAGGFGGFYNKLTIGGATGSSTLTITGGSTFGEIASTKTVAHTISFPSGITTSIYKWSVTGTAGNVVTIAPGTAASTYTLLLLGPATSGIDYLSISYCTMDTLSYGEFYAGANSTNTIGNTRVIFTATPAPRTLYWVGGTGNWSSTTKWSTSSGGPPGAAIPISLDSVIFNSASNATAYTATIDSGVTVARCASFTMAGPASGNVTFAGTVGIAFHGSATFAATGITRTYSGQIALTGNSSSTWTQNGVQFSSTVRVNGLGATWSLGSALVFDANPRQFILEAGTFRSMGFAMSPSTLQGQNSVTTRRVELSSSVVTLQGVSNGTALGFSNSSNLLVNVSVDAGTSTITIGGGTNQEIRCSSITLRNLTLGAGVTSNSFSPSITYNNLTFTGRTSVGITLHTFQGDQTITGTLTLSAGTASAFRTFLASNTIGTSRTLTVANLAAGATDVDFRDITIAGAAAPISGTRFGDAKGNSGITFPAAKTVYWALASGTSNWGTASTGSWGASPGTADATQFPLPQDTAVFNAAIFPPNAANITINAVYNIGTVDMSLRTSNTMTLTVSLITSVYGNWINGTTSTPGGTGTLTFSGRTTQTITSAGRTFPTPLVVNSPGGTVQLLDAYTNSNASPSALVVTNGTFNANGYNVSFTGTSSTITSSNTNTRTIAFGAGTWTLAGSGTVFDASTSTSLTITGTGTVSLTSASAKTFNGGGISYSGITLNQGGAGTLTITGDNTFKNITNTYSATGATTISLGTTLQTLTSPWTATGAAGRVLTINGSSATSPGTLRFTGAGIAAEVDYLAINNVRAYDIFDEWYAGDNSTNGGSLGWYFRAAGGTIYSVTISESSSSSDAIQAASVALSSILEIIQSADFSEAQLAMPSDISESAQALDETTAQADLSAETSESAQALDETTAQADLNSVASESVQALDEAFALGDFGSAIDESAQALDQADAQAVFSSDAQESAQTDDLASAQVDLLSVVDEAAQIDDAASAVVDFSSAISEDVQALDTVDASANFNATASEDAQALDDIAAQADFLADASESAQGFDTAEAQLDMFPSVDEAAQGDDSASATAEFGVLVSEDGQALDEAAAVASFGAEANETASAIDQASASADLGSAVSESVQVSEAANGAADFGSEISEAGSVDDSSSASGVFQTDITDTAQVSDENSSQVEFSSALLETAQALDQTNASAVFRPRIIERARPQDQVLVSASIFGAAANETANASDAISSQAVFPTDVNETVASSDSASAAQLFVTTLSESAQILDSVSSSQGFVSQVSEAGTALDEVVVAASVFGASTAETARASDQASSLVTVFGSISETATARDIPLAFLIFPASVSDTAQALDQIAGQVLFRAALSEQVNVSDSAASQSVSNAATSESAAVSDQAAVGPSVFGATMAESGQGSDQLQAQAEFGGLVDESATEADNAVAALVLSGNTTETAQVADESLSSQTFASDMADTVSAADDLQALTVLQSATSESAQPSEQASAAVSFGGAVVEEAAGLDQAQAQATFGSVANETATAVDSTVAAMITLGNVAEAAQAVEAFLSNQTFAANTSETVSAADVLQALATFQAAANETGQAADQASTVVVFAGSVSEQVSVSDLAIVAASIFNAALQDQARAQDTVDAPGSVYNPSVADTAQVQDIVSPAVVMGPAVDESSQVSEQANAVFIAVGQVNEEATAVDVAAALAAFVARTEDHASAADINLVAPSIFNAIALAAAQAVDSTDAPGSVFNASMTESVTLLDSLIGGFLWNLIDDSQDANWQNVPAVQVAGWVQVDDSQTTTWQAVDSAQVSTWTEVDTENSPGWQQEPPP